jgi:hypothetical protein
MGNAALHLLVLASTVVAGTAVSLSVFDIDQRTGWPRTGDPRTGGRSVRDGAIVTLATGVFLTGFAAALGGRDPLPGTTAAGAGVASVAQVVADQHRAAALLLAVAACLIVAAAALVRDRRARRSPEVGGSPEVGRVTLPPHQVPSPRGAATARR